MAKIEELKVGIHLMKRNLLIITIVLLVPILFSCTKEDIGYKSGKLHVAVAGTLSSLLTSNQRDTITSLVLSGTIDARDFKCLRDFMPRLAELDLSAVTIAAYTGTGGPFGTVYPANTLPEFAFCNYYPIAKTSLTSITLPNSVTSIGTDAFFGCRGLTTITLPNSLTSIGNDAFAACSGLTTITLPNSITSIGTTAFANCSGLTSITAQSSTPINLNASTYVFTGVPTTCTLYVPSTSISAYQAANQWKDFAHIVGI